MTKNMWFCLVTLIILTISIFSWVRLRFLVDKVEGGTETKGHYHAHISKPFSVAPQEPFLGNGLAHTAPHGVLKSLV